jgi:hypothetical protein
VQRQFDDTTQTHSLMLFQQLLKPHPEEPKSGFSRRKSQQVPLTRFKVEIFTITQGPTPAAPRTTFVKPAIAVDDYLSRSINWFARLHFSCINGCVVVWLPGCLITVLAMNFAHPCIGGFTLDAFRCGFLTLVTKFLQPSYTRI